MPSWAWIIVGIAAALVVAAVVYAAFASRRRARLQERFGPEYDRTVERRETRREAEAELAAREERLREFDIRPLGAERRRYFADEWQAVQARFVDSPTQAIGEADGLIARVMAERGYPMADFDHRADDVSVDHPEVVENYRIAHEISRASAAGRASTEDLRQAMQHYRALFDDLVEAPADEPLQRGRIRDQEPEEVTRR